MFLSQFLYNKIYSLSYREFTISVIWMPKSRDAYLFLFLFIGRSIFIGHAEKFIAVMEDILPWLLLYRCNIPSRLSNLLGSKSIKDYKQLYIETL